MSDLGLLGPPIPVHMKWWIGPTMLSLSLEIMLEEGRCQGTPMWPCSPAPTYRCHWVKDT